MENSRMLLDNNLRRLLAERNWQQKDLAERTGIHKSSICKYMNGTGDPTFDKLDRLADGFGVPVSELFVDSYRENNPTKQDQRFRAFLRNNHQAIEVVKLLQTLDEYQLRTVHDVIQGLIKNNFGSKKSW